MGQAFDYALTKATDDVAETLRWLVAQGAAINNERGGTNEAFGNVLVELSLDGVTLTITRDRGQWMLDVQSGELPRFDFDVIHVALTGDEHWSRKTSSPLPVQLPDGVSWMSELPQALEWLRTTADAATKLETLQRRRAAQLFG